jgi:hypothetical protein
VAFAVPFAVVSPFNRANSLASFRNRVLRRGSEGLRILPQSVIIRSAAASLFVVSSAPDALRAVPQTNLVAASVSQFCFANGRRGAFEKYPRQSPLRNPLR